MRGAIDTSQSNLASKIAEDESKSFFGFWVYIMTDLVLFATLFATYAVLRNNTFGGPAGSEIFNMPFVLAETIILLTSSFTSGIGTIFARQKNAKYVLIFFGVTFLLGLMFLSMEIYEFHNLVNDGFSWQRSAFLSSFFTLVGTHGLHITAGLIWMAVLLVRLFQKGFIGNTVKRLMLASMFWHFLDIVWIFIFTFVYLMGAK